MQQSSVMGEQRRARTALGPPMHRAVQLKSGFFPKAKDRPPHGKIHSENSNFFFFSLVIVHDIGNVKEEFFAFLNVFSVID